jgi:hypothetical protein
MAFCAGRFVCDDLGREARRNLELDVLAASPADGDPGVRRNEVEVGTVADHRHGIPDTQVFLHLVGHRHAAEARAQDHDFGHGSPPPARIRAVRAC